MFVNICDWWICRKCCVCGCGIVGGGIVGNVVFCKDFIVKNAVNVK